MNWKKLITSHTYSLTSLLFILLYVWIVFIAFSFILQNIRISFDVNQELIQSQIVTLDRTSYNDIAQRFALPVEEQP